MLLQGHQHSLRLWTVRLGGSSCCSSTWICISRTRTHAVSCWYMAWKYMKPLSDVSNRYTRPSGPGDPYCRSPYLGLAVGASKQTPMTTRSNTNISKKNHYICGYSSYQQLQPPPECGGPTNTQAGLTWLVPDPVMTVVGAHMIEQSICMVLGISTPHGSHRCV